MLARSIALLVTHWIGRPNYQRQRQR